MKVPRGAVYGLIGKNGAGKTTAMRMLMGLLRPNSGTALMLGRDMLSADRAHRERVAYVSQEQQLPGWMTLAELEHFVSFFYPGWDGECAKHLLKRFELSRERQVGLMSGGEKRKAAILLALAASPEVLLLDEPAAGLDPIARRELVDALVDVLSDGSSRTILFSTHIMSDLERIADHVGIMDKGKMVLSSPLEELKTSTRRVQIIFEGDRVPENFRMPGAVRVEVNGPVLTCITKIFSEGQLEDIRKSHKARVNVFPLGLEDIFIELFGSDNDDFADSKNLN